MKQRYIFILLVAITVISSFFIFSDVVEARTVTIETTCENGPNNDDSGGCGTACVNLCNESSFYSDSAGQALCSQQANNTRAWRKYRAIRTTSYIWECTAFPCYEQARHTISKAFMNNLCSTGDKCYGERCADGGGSPYLRPGYCDCGRVGPTPYKICCMNGIPVNAIWAPGRLQDGYSPEEGMCPGGFEPPVGVLTCAGSAPVIPIPNGTLPPDTNGTPNGNGNGTPNGNGNIPSGTCVGGIHLPGSVTADVWASPDCLPSQPRNGRQTTISWRGTAPNICDSIIGGGTPDNSDVNCTRVSQNTGWSPAGTAGTVTVSPTFTQDYVVGCRRQPYTCEDNNSFAGGGSTTTNRNNCQNNCALLNTTYGDTGTGTLRTCSCSQGDCVAHYSSEEISADPSRCAAWQQCLSGTSISCTPGQPDCVNCDPLVCAQRRCKRHGYNQSVTSKPICASSATDSQVVRVIQRPTITIFETNPQRTQILLNQFINLRWNAVAPDSGAPGIQVNTTLRCTPSIGSGGDAEGWGGTLNSLDSSGTVSNLSPARTTRYQLVCRNSDDIAPNQCFYDSDLRARDIKVFTPDLREVPASPR